MPSTAIVLAAGEGTRMRSKRAKVLHELLGRPLMGWSVEVAREAGCDRVIVVVGNDADDVRSALSGTDVECVEQTERLGTGHAVRCALEQAGVTSGTVVVLSGDSPLIRPETISRLAGRIDGSCACAVLTMTPPDVSGYGRLTFDETGQVTGIIEDKDCTDEQRRTLMECNSSIYAFDGAALAAHVGEIGHDNAQGEYYLTDMVAILRAAGLPVTSVHVDDHTELLGVNSRSQLADATRVMQARINRSLMDAGVTMLDPSLVWVAPGVTVGADTTILPMTMLMGDTRIGSDCTIGPNTRLTDTHVGDDCVVDETVAISATLENHVDCGPRAYLRPGAHLLDHSKAGTHVEIKNSTIGEGSKVPHLSYIGDTTMGSGVNIGAGSITCNYDGVNKNHTTIGDDVFVGSDTMMVAPVNIGDGALVGASSCITKDVPADALALERSEQKMIDGYARSRRDRLERERKGQR
ncbi:MAG: bifunctional UDP-N-acetylglucosamine diphosphorylase/glucosamine-1-phosphate N-acetyltransferase GlmU [Atopobiaceae bacterium]|nr:bifunctional UDP-N-acetylglucosamine diphosphorylase/glucosamine-1-phosphate N-acetyltransferase GlmU [Atopobiaceae bacterium]MCI2173972.1 bifunctional UDP-N-acetylglucosamine diphosphorylase/glucosamine-1-phosphate N-acetyltransferase GlmU [Atopobiaceae bacterium]MCI2207938.1 bifunctional UDP-N-acetylglucosamine diphosphorylase/glucosamine-1-phosphate N-acetyltransferase GlmU [Atopobiaceae bacterium]